MKEVVSSVHTSAPPDEKLAFYEVWAETYDQDVAILNFHSPKGAADSIIKYFPGDRATALVLDVACGTGTVAKHLKDNGFQHFVGVDGSPAMLEKAKKTGFYQEFKQCILGQQQIPVKKDSFDIAVIAGALSVGHVPVFVIRELCDACKPGGYICMTSRDGDDNLEYKAGLESEIKKMVEEKLWKEIAVTVVENWEKATSGDGYISGSVYFYQKL